MKYKDYLKRPRVDKRTKLIGMKCDGCNETFYHKTISGITICNNCGTQTKQEKVA